jgi:hypothetical protein
MMDRKRIIQYVVILAGMVYVVASSMMHLKQ